MTHKSHSSFTALCCPLSMEDTEVDNNCSQELHYPDLPGPGCVVDTNQDEVENN